MQELDLSQNQINNVSHFMYLSSLHGLKTLTIRSNQFMDSFGELNLRMVAINMFPQLEMLNGTPMTKEEPVI